MTHLIMSAESLLQPFTSPFLLLSVVILLLLMSEKESMYGKYLPAFIFTVFFYISYKLALTNPIAARWLERLESPFSAVALLLVLPAFLGNRKVRWFLTVPSSLLVIMTAIEIFTRSSALPDSASWFNFIASPGLIVSATTGILIILSVFLSMKHFRTTCRVVFIILLVYGGILFRHSLDDYRTLSSSQRSPGEIITLMETSPVLKKSNHRPSMPSAPCRFASGGGYVQGCPMESLQHVLQLRKDKIMSGNLTELQTLAVGIASLLTLLIFLVVGARLWCGWFCPLASIGDIFDWIRKKLGIDHFKYKGFVRKLLLTTGITAGTAGLLMAVGYGSVDSSGEFAGLKIPPYPFCKMCPGEEIFPVASGGPSQLPPLPGTEWMGGFFTVVLIAMVAFFFFGFLTSRRLWCRLCPMGLIGGLFNRGGAVSLEKDSEKCNGCATCREVCPVDIDSVYREMENRDVSSMECLLCLKCIEKCPRDGCLSLAYCGSKVTESSFSGENQ